MHFIIAYYNIIIIIIMHFYFRDPTIPQISSNHFFWNWYFSKLYEIFEYLKILHIFLAIWSINVRDVRII